MNRGLSAPRIVRPQANIGEKRRVKDLQLIQSVRIVPSVKLMFGGRKPKIFGFIVNSDALVMLYSLQLPFSARKPWQSVTTLNAELGSRSERQGLGLTSIVLGPLNACLRGACLPGILSMSGESDLLIVMKIIQVSGY